LAVFFAAGAGAGFHFAGCAACPGFGAAWAGFALGGAALAFDDAAGAAWEPFGEAAAGAARPRTDRATVKRRGRRRIGIGCVPATMVPSVVSSADPESTAVFAFPSAKSRRETDDAAPR
jgi:hypothetical protein